MQVRVGAVWKTVEKAWVRRGGVWKVVESAKVADTYRPAPQDPEITDWNLVEGSQFTDPTAYVPSVAIGRGPELIGTSEHTCSWSPNDPTGHGDFNVIVEWWVNEGTGWYQDGVTVCAPATNNAKRTYEITWDIYCKVYYKNPTTSATGPVTTTATI